MWLALCIFLIYLYNFFLNSILQTQTFCYPLCSDAFVSTPRPWWWSRTVVVPWAALTLLLILTFLVLHLMPRWPLRSNSGLSPGTHLRSLVSWECLSTYLVITHYRWGVSTASFCPSWSAVPLCGVQLWNLIWSCLTE